jgi:CBS domain-containing protein
LCSKVQVADAKTLMSTSIVTLNVISKVKDIVEVLDRTTIETFPVVNGGLPDESNHLNSMHSSIVSHLSAQQSPIRDTDRTALSSTLTSSFFTRHSNFFIGSIYRDSLISLLQSLRFYDTPNEAKDSELDQPTDHKINENENTQEGGDDEKSYSLHLSSLKESTNTSSMELPKHTIPLQNPSTANLLSPAPPTSSGKSFIFSFSSSSPTPTHSDLPLQPHHFGKWVNLGPLIDRGAHRVSMHMSGRRIWSLFRSLGMRMLVVINDEGIPIGVITRRDMIRIQFDH